MYNRAEQEDTPVVWINESRIKRVKASEVSSSDNASIFFSGPNEDFYENLEAWFDKPIDEDAVQFFASSLESFAYTEATRIGKSSLDIKSKNKVQRLKLQAPTNMV